MQQTLAGVPHEPDARPPYAEQSRGTVQTPDSPFGDRHGEPSNEFSTANRGSVK